MTTFTMANVGHRLRPTAFQGYCRLRRRLITWTYFRPTDANSTRPATAINHMGSPLRGLLSSGAETKIHTQSERRPIRIATPIHG